MDMTKRQAAATTAAAAVFALAAAIAARAGATAGQDVIRRQAVEVAVPANGSDQAVLGRPVALALDADRLYVADALDCAVKVFSRDGRFLFLFGRKGQGPGELSFPSGVAAAGGGIVVADKLNFRIQVFDGQGERHGGFKVPFAPDRVFALGGGKLLITANPTGRRKGERLLHIYDAGGHPLWE
ncbi:MAG TPA: 6-bladed beta-propeller, partial [Acidobacteriota bacterium]|nr:6-bladed beta-propeller [Acidobacteriota bacterium]